MTKTKTPAYDDIASQHDALEAALAEHELPALEAKPAEAKDIAARREAANETLRQLAEEARTLVGSVDALARRSEAARKCVAGIIETLSPARPGYGASDPGRLAAARDALAAARAASQPARTG